VAFVLALCAAPAFAQAPQGVTIQNVSCDNTTTGVGQRCNDAAYWAIQQQYGANWISSNPGVFIVVLYGGNNKQQTYKTTAAGTLIPQGSCVAPDTSLWDDFISAIVDFSPKLVPEISTATST
jgi:hypothetical protein